MRPPRRDKREREAPGGEEARLQEYQARNVDVDARRAYKILRRWGRELGGVRREQGKSVHVEKKSGIERGVHCRSQSVKVKVVSRDATWGT